MSNKAVNYHVIKAFGMVELMTKVRDLLDEGWVPQGGVAHNPSDYTFFQAMVNYNEK